MSNIKKNCNSSHEGVFFLKERRGGKRNDSPYKEEESLT